MTREQELEMALSAALVVIEGYEKPTSSLDCSDHFVAMASILCKVGNDECLKILHKVLESQDT